MHSLCIRSLTSKEVPSSLWIPGLKIETGGTQWWYNFKLSET
jgi:hypothetical protein